MEAGSILFPLPITILSFFVYWVVVTRKEAGPLQRPMEAEGTAGRVETPSFSEHPSCVEPSVGAVPEVSSALDGTGVSAVSERAQRVLIVSVLMKTIVNWSCSGPLCVSHNALLSTFTRALPKEGVIILISKPRKLRLRDW